MDEVLRGIPFTYTYIDDVLIASASPEEHLRTVFERLDQYGILINPNKCLFGFAELSFLGHSVSSQGIAPLPEKVQVVRNLPTPQSQRKLGQFVGMVNFYHRFIPRCAELMQPLHALMDTKSQSIEWSDTALTAFSSIKDALANATLLSYPQADTPISLVTDASDIGVGAVLQQHVHGHRQPISFFSRKLTPTQARYSTELLGVYLAIHHFRHFLEGCNFHVYTDHKPLTHATPLTDRSPCPSTGSTIRFHQSIYVHNTSRQR